MNIIDAIRQSFEPVKLRPKENVKERIRRQQLVHDADYPLDLNHVNKYIHSGDLLSNIPKRKNGPLVQKGDGITDVMRKLERNAAAVQERQRYQQVVESLIFEDTVNGDTRKINGRWVFSDKVNPVRTGADPTEPYNPVLHDLKHPYGYSGHLDSRAYYINNQRPHGVWALNGATDIGNVTPATDTTTYPGKIRPAPVDYSYGYQPTYSYDYDTHDVPILHTKRR